MKTYLYDNTKSREALKSKISKRERNLNIFLEDIIYIKEKVEEFFGIKDLTIRNRASNYVIARKIFAILCKPFRGKIPLQVMGECIKRDHATILHYWRCHDSWLLHDKVYNIELDLLYKIQNEMKFNPYERYLGKEDILQNSVVKYMKLKYPNVFVIHVPNEGKRSPFERFKFKYLGGISGVPDLLIFKSNDKYNGLAIELKAGSNKPTENQQRCLKRLSIENWMAVWINNFDDAKLTIDNYLRNE
jgi:hypothetical protein